MNSIFTITIALVGIVVVLLTIAWLGFQIEPESFSPHPENTKDAGAVNVSPEYNVDVGDMINETQESGRVMR